MSTENAPATVLVADDAPEMLALIERHLKNFGHHVHLAHDGQEAWDKIKKLRPDLVLLDVMMPGMTGWEVCHSIRHDQALHNTAVIILTGIGESLNATLSPIYEPDAYLDKPFEFPSLDQAIAVALARRRGMARAEQMIEGAVEAISHPPAKKGAAAKKPEAKPAAKKPEAKKPEAKKPEAKPAAKKPEAKKPEAKKPEAKKPEVKAAAKKAEAKPAAKQAEAKPAAKKPEAKKPEAKKPEAKKPEAKATAKKPEAKPAAKKPEAKKPEAKPAAKKPEAKKPEAKKPEAKKPEPKPAAKQPEKAGKPAAKPAGKKPAKKLAIMSEVAVTGAAGFIGSAVLRLLLEQGRKVRVLLEPGASTRNLEGLVGDIDRVTVDVADQASMQRALSGCKVLYHLAAVYKTWTPDPTTIYRVNVEGTAATLLAARSAGIERVVYTSSIAAIGLRSLGGDAPAPSDEQVAFNLWPIANDYIVTKHLSERVAMQFAQSGMSLVVVNPAFPFGPGDVGPTPTGKIILSMLRRQVPGYADGGFCAIDVDDCAAGHLLAEEKGRVGERYILGNHNISFKAFFALVARAAGVPEPRLKMPRALAAAVGSGFELWSDLVTHSEPLATRRSVLYATAHAYFDNGKARRELGLPSRPLETTIERAVSYFRQSGMV